MKIVIDLPNDEPTLDVVQHIVKCASEEFVVTFVDGDDESFDISIVDIRLEK